MGTRGLYVFFYEGIYYVFYNHMDSYPEALGQLLVIMLKTENYSTWGKIIQDQIDDGNYIPRKFIYEHGRMIEKDPNEKDIVELKKEEKWEIQKIGKNYQSITLLKWNYKPMIKYNQALFPFIEAVCPTFDKSFFLFKTKDINEVLNNYSGEDWIYITDLDSATFAVYGGKNVKFFINNIPCNWIEKLKDN